eukprot:14053237-Alexandrium_andersonii.AAC.1
MIRASSGGQTGPSQRRPRLHARGSTWGRKTTAQGEWTESESCGPDNELHLLDDRIAIEGTPRWT